MAAVFLALLIYLNAYVGYAKGEPHINDYMLVHIGGNALRSGMDLYDPAQWDAAHRLFGNGYTDNPVFIYPLPFAFFFVPFSFLSAEVGEVVFLLVSEILLVVSAWLLLRGMDFKDPKRFALIVFSVALFLPTINAWWARQQSFLLFFFLVAAYLLIMRHKDWAAGAMLALVALRPSPVLVLALAIIIWAVIHRRWRLWISTAGSALVLFLLSSLIRPGWLTAWLDYTVGANGKLQTYQAFVPTLWGMLIDFNIAARQVVGLAISLLLIAFSVWWMRKYKHTNFTSLVLIFVPLSLFLSPYAWNYDQLFLLLPLFLIMRHADTSAPKLRTQFWTWTLIVMLGLPYALRLVALARGRDTLSALTSLAVWGLGLWMVSTPYARSARLALPKGVPDRRKKRKPKPKKERPRPLFLFGAHIFTFGAGWELGCRLRRFC